MKSLKEIQSNIDRIPYTYLIGWSTHNIWYYGRRTAKGCHPSDLWNTYFTSSKYVTSFVKNNGEPDVIEIRHIFDTVEKCIIWESTVLRQLHVSTNDKFLNKKEGDNKWDASGRRVVIENSTGIHISIKCCEYDITLHTHPNKDKTQVRMLDNTIKYIDNNDPRILSGELKHYLTGIPKSSNHKDSMSKMRIGKFIGRKDSNEVKQKRVESLQKYYKKTQEYNTPFGIFFSTPEFSSKMGITQGFAYNIFNKNNTLPITSRSQFQSPDFIQKDWIGKTWKELGFYFIKF